MTYITVGDERGHLYDWDIVERIKNGLMQLFEQTETDFRFLIPLDSKDQPFARALVHTVRYMRPAYPSKHITILLTKKPDDIITRRLEGKEIETQKKILQDVFTVDLTKGLQNDPFDITDLLDGVCDTDSSKSEVVFMYNYHQLLRPQEKREITKLSMSNKLLIDCTSKSTEDRIFKLIDMLPEKKRRILLDTIAGKPSRQIASEWSCSTDTIHYHVVKAIATVDRQLNVMHHKYDAKVFMK